jgi:hypothetical protein
MTNPPIKSILGISICIALGINSDSFAKQIIEAKQPSAVSVSMATDNQLLLTAGVFDPLTESLDFKELNLSVKDSSKYSIVQFHAGKADSKWLTEQGFKVVSYLPNNAFIIANPKNVKLSSNSDIRWQGVYKPQYKLTPNLWQKNIIKQSKHNLIVTFFNDTPKKEISNLITKKLPEIDIKSVFVNTYGIVISVNHSDLNETLSKLSSIDSVQSIDKRIEVRQLNTEATAAIQANLTSGSTPLNDNYTPSNTPIWDKGLFGTGQIVAVADSGLDSNVDWFVHFDNGTTVSHEVTLAEQTTPPALGTLHLNRKVIGNFVMPGALAYDHADARYHGTHVTGSVAGDRLANIDLGPAGSISSPFDAGYDNDDGMAPNAQILFQDHSGFNSDGEYGIVQNLDRQVIYQQAYDAGARIHSNSWGAATEGAYVFDDFVADTALRQFEDLLIVAAAGNDGDRDTNTTVSPSNAKSVLSVGALLHGNAREVAGFSNRGPTDDGRMKPDIMATGTFIESANGSTTAVTSQIEPPTRLTISGTSMATPITSGGVALMRQYFTDGFYPTGVAKPMDIHNPTGALMKAALINGANTDVGHFNKDVGWGRINLSDTIMFDDSDKQLRAWELTNSGGLSMNESIQFQLGVKTEEDLAITLAWYDLPQSFVVSKQLINDLDLTVEINGETYLGNVFIDAGVSEVGGSRDSINSVEQIRIPDPIAGIYTITVKGSNIPGDGSSLSTRQGFGLVATGSFDDIGSSPNPLGEVSNINSQMLGDNGINISWDDDENADFFEIYRVEGNCSEADFADLRFIGNSESNSFTDFKTLNGLTYSYKIRSAKLGTLGSLSDSCSEITSLQACLENTPQFDESSISISNNTGDICHTELNWSAAIASCPSTPEIKYNIYRSEDPDFVPNSDNLLDTVSTTHFDDIYAPDVAAYYIVRAEDNSTGGNGPNGGSETFGTKKIRSLAVGEGFSFSPILEDVDTVSIMNLSFPWQVVSNNATSGILSYKTSEADADYPDEMCNYMTTNTISLTGVSNPTLDYNAQYSFEENWDGVIVEISTDNGVNWTDLPPTGGYPSDLSLTEPQGTPINGCGYPASQGAFSGSNNGYQAISHDLSAYENQEVLVRWALTSDGNTTENGMYIDDINYPNVGIPNACTVNTAPLLPTPGLYYDKGRSGHGFVIEPIAFPNVEDAYFTVFYTYKDDGTPEWFTSLAEMVNNVLVIDLEDANLNGTLNRFIYDHNAPNGTGNPSLLDTSITGTLTIDFNSDTISSNEACNDGTVRGSSLALASWQLGAEQGEWCIEPLTNLTGPAPANNDMGGTWYAGSSDSGWGLSMSFTESGVIIVTVYYYDEVGEARWVQGTQTGFNIGEEIILNMNEFTGFGRTDTPIAPIGVSAGTLTLTINDNNADDNDGEMSLDLTFQAGNDSSSWTRTAVPVKIFTEAH